MLTCFQCYFSVSLDSIALVSVNTITASLLRFASPPIFTLTESVNSVGGKKEARCLLMGLVSTASFFNFSFAPTIERHSVASNAAETSVSLLLDWLLPHSSSEIMKSVVASAQEWCDARSWRRWRPLLAIHSTTICVSLRTWDSAINVWLRLSEASKVAGSRPCSRRLIGIHSTNDRTRPTAALHHLHSSSCEGHDFLDAFRQCIEL